MARKETLHILRDPATLFFALFIPLIELFMLGYAIETNVRNIRTVVLDQAKTKDTERFMRAMEESTTYRVVALVQSEENLNYYLTSGKARVGIWFPENFSRRLENGERAQILVLVDGSESSIAGEGLNVANLLALRESLARTIGDRPLPVEIAPVIKFNPNIRSANFFIPGLVVVMCQMMAIMLSANAVVREKELGTLEQLFMTPVRAGELILGKLIPYLVLTVLEFCTIILVMMTAFQVPLHGNFFTLMAMTLPFVFCFLGLGLLISTRAATREAASQMAMGTMMPSIFLSGYVFPMDSMPLPFYLLAQIFPTTWLIDAARGVILRGAGWRELWPHAVVLWAMGLVVCGLAMTKFKKRLV